LIALVVSTVLPQAASLQVGAFSDALRLAVNPRVAVPLRMAPNRAVRNQTGVLSLRVQQDSLRQRARFMGKSRRAGALDRILFATSFLRRDLPDLSRPLDKQLTILRI
jgi:hypothetical protein